MYGSGEGAGFSVARVFAWILAVVNEDGALKNCCSGRRRATSRILLTRDGAGENDAESIATAIMPTMRRFVLRLYNFNPCL